MPQENKQEKKQEKTKLVLKKTHVAMLSISATTLVLLLAFSCYGCSYQPITAPTFEEAELTFENLYNSTWELDDTMGTPTLSELNNEVVERIVIDPKQAGSEGVNITLHMKDSPPACFELTYRAGYGFTLNAGSKTFAVKILYSASKDGETETLTMIGDEDKRHCYYLKK